MMLRAHSARERIDSQAHNRDPNTQSRSALRDMLASVSALAIPADVEADCLVIDNASTDNTAAVVDDFARSAALPMRRVLEPRPGSSFARNRAVDETTSDYIFFIDDDAVAERDWAADLLDDMRRRDLDAACGMVLPRWSSTPPKWLGPSLWVKLAVHDNRAIESAPCHLPSGWRAISAPMCILKAGLRSSVRKISRGPRRGRRQSYLRRGYRAVRTNIPGRHDRLCSERDRESYDPAGADTRAYLRRKSFAFILGTAFAGLQNHNRLDKLVRNGVRMAAVAVRGDSERTLYHDKLECANFFGYWRGRSIAR